ncbi:hypothetical protein [Bradyrhizobium sp. AZCC 1577]|uniref:hypothetical protein n=1 Tax=Bradyrhizobium sp. AZCC 1577 TaxID=3117019 RepID=UPI002FF2261E
MTALEGSVGALVADISHPQPFPIPGIAAILWVNPTCDKEAFRDQRAPFLSQAEQPHELD